MGLYIESCQSSKFFRPVIDTRIIFLGSADVDGTWCQHESTNDVAKIEGERKRSLASPILSSTYFRLRNVRFLKLEHSKN